ncbi:hypothetical protein K469DRAFT_226685 [Zopfia rhizophila CBS 207.26]|uniref:Uncharacterized protein n=1 Tax=Zopfia rhizophila CBS 207.26 TaxID=1314779 RepID=A0A6A6DXB9_9PEZI|nr:hypothetical protein K469DRAFT_226685 [Zopfia rhizophila CBS 207.26]
MHMLFTFDTSTIFPPPPLRLPMVSLPFRTVHTTRRCQFEGKPVRCSVLWSSPFVFILTRHLTATLWPLKWNLPQSFVSYPRLHPYPPSSTSTSPHHKIWSSLLSSFTPQHQTGWIHGHITMTHLCKAVHPDQRNCITNRDTMTLNTRKPSARAGRNKRLRSRKGEPRLHTASTPSVMGRSHITAQANNRSTVSRGCKILTAPSHQPLRKSRVIVLTRGITPT